MPCKSQELDQLREDNARLIKDLIPALERAADVLANYGYFNEAREALEVLAIVRADLQRGNDK